MPSGLITARPPAALSTAHDIPLLISSSASSSERRITPSWTIAHLKSKLESVTGIPPGSQKLFLRLPDQQQETPIQAEDEESVEVGRWPLVPYAEIKVTSTNPASNFTIPPDDSVPKYTMPSSDYETLPDTVLAYKRSHQIGRFDPHAPGKQEQKLNEMWREVQERSITVGSRCRLPPTLHRRGTISYIGPIPSLPGLTGAPWIGLTLDEPVGKNDGSITGERYFQCKKNEGVFVRADRVEAGSGEGFGVLGVDEGEGEEMEEI